MSPRSALSTLALAATLLVSATAQAQIFRAHLAMNGSDANPCTLSRTGLSRGLLSTTSVEK